MPMSLKDASVHAAFREVAQRQPPEIDVGDERCLVITPFSSPQDRGDNWIYFLLMVDRFNRDDGVSPASVEWRNQDGRARPDWLVIENITESQRHADALVWPTEMQRNQVLRRIGKGGKASGDVESLKDLTIGARTDHSF